MLAWIAMPYEIEQTFGLFLPNANKINWICPSTNLASLSKSTFPAWSFFNHTASKSSDTASEVCIASAPCISSSSSYTNMPKSVFLASRAKPFSSPILFSTGRASLSHHCNNLPDPRMPGFSVRRMVRNGARRAGLSWT